jgi:hypothetical protein
MAFSALALTGDSASIRVWCSHSGVPLGTAITAGHAIADRLRRVPGRRKKSQNRFEGGVCLLTKGVLIRVRPGEADCIRLGRTRLVLLNRRCWVPQPACEETAIG